MNENSKPLYALTIDEFVELNRKIHNEQLEEILKLSGQQSETKQEKDIVFIKDVMEITGYTKATLYTKICKYEIPVLSRRAPLTFSRKEIVQWIKNGKPSVIDQEADAYLSRSKNPKNY